MITSKLNDEFLLSLNEKDFSNMSIEGIYSMQHKLEKEIKKREEEYFKTLCGELLPILACIHRNFPDKTIGESCFSKEDDEVTALDVINYIEREIL